MASNTTYANNISTYIDTAWESKYISKGRTFLSDGIYKAEIGAEYNGFSTLLWFGTWHNYREYNLGLNYQTQFAQNWKIKFGYLGLKMRDAETRLYGNEADVAISYHKLSWLVPKVHTYYDMKSKGYFIQLSVDGHWQLTDKWSIHPRIQQGFDHGFTSKHFDGLQHAEIRSELRYKVSNQLTIKGFVAHSWALTDMKRTNPATAKDQTYGGLKFSYNF
ncbi:MAG: hypothetical protein ACPGUD_01310 [Parashewanella sp.]